MTGELNLYWKAMVLAMSPEDLARFMWAPNSSELTAGLKDEAERRFKIAAKHMDENGEEIP